MNDKYIFNYIKTALGRPTIGRRPTWHMSCVSNGQSSPASSTGLQDEFVRTLDLF